MLDFYTKLRGDLEDKGSKINQYDRCVANKIVDGNQMTVIWHVDDLKVSHKKAEANTKFAKWMKTIYGENLQCTEGTYMNI